MRKHLIKWICLIAIFIFILIPDSYAQFVYDQVDFKTGKLTSLKIGDINADGHPDLVGIDYDSKHFSVFTNTGNGSFGERRDYSLAYNPASITLADVNSDGSLDINVVYTFSSPNYISIFTNTGTGAFNRGQDVNIPVLYFSASIVAVKDLNNDGRPDLAIADNSLYLAVLTATGDGSFGLAGTYTGGGLQGVVYAEDMNGDGNPDLINLGTYEGYVNIFTNDGQGKFVQTFTDNYGGLRETAAIGDFNGDTLMDFAIAIGLYKQIIVFMNSKTGFRSNYLLNVGNVSSIYSADMNGDGNLDLVTSDANSGISVFKGNGTGTFDVADKYPTSSGYLSIAIDDLNGNGTPDLIPIGSDSVITLFFTKFQQGIVDFPNGSYAQGSIFNITATSGLPVKLISSDPTVLAYSGHAATATGIGLVTITGIQEGNNNWQGVTTTGVVNILPTCASIVDQQLIPDRITLTGNAFAITIPGCFLYSLPLSELKLRGPAALLPNNVVNFTGTGIVTITGINSQFSRYLLGVVTVVSEFPTDINDRNSEISAAKIYPNPSDGEFSIDGIENGKAEIFNFLGQKIGTFTIHKKTEIALSEKGIYLVIVKTDNGNSVIYKKVVIQ